MDKQLDTCFDRVEKALGTLVDSISKYHPSVNQVNELGLADIELNKGLEELQTHQSNYKRIQDLRAATTSLDSQIKDTLRLLANTRKELVGASATVFPSDAPSYDVNYDELLAYARRISKTTLPPASALNSTSTDNGAIGSTDAATPAAATPNGAQPTPGNANGQDSTQQTPAADPPATALPEDLQWNVNPLSGVDFAPWPNEEQVRKGAMAQLAFISEQGIDAEDYDPEEEKARKEREEEERRAAEEKERIEREERERRAREEQVRIRVEREREQREAWRRGSVVDGGAGAGAAAGQQPVSTSPVGEKVQFQFMADDDEDDDE
ncbi:uncharacterized protein F4822DRAFT_423147 [Hypoxylon trugodes]|uniref:uncharacterized protein n=1 Tax=Hypoxylon trugodes TaxID=326681 RepID=UPI0021910D08|nr:uncharacterized protein F4822DRAFT_423147 [Hypoxylon trugodes]KAI1382655.1 hypothetical protein F4822DRAFT_423147 [Hypoxylon trugodes]